MFEFFFKRSKVFLGVDIGTSTVKVAELSISDNRPFLSNYGRASLENVVSDELDQSSREAVLAELIRKIIKQSGIKGKDAYVSLPSFGGLITIIEMPEMEQADLEQAVRYEAQKYIPTSLDDVVLSWEIIKSDQIELIGADNELSSEASSGEKKGKNTRILLVAASKSKVLSYERIVKSAGLRLKLLEIESFPLANALVGNDQGAFIILDIGSRICNIILVEKGLIRANRNIDAGGSVLTKAIARGMGIEEKRAEKLKISSRNFFDDHALISFPSLELISEEIARIIEEYSRKNSALKVERVILSGGTSNMVGLESYLTKKIGIVVKKGNPFGRVKHSLPSSVENMVAPQFSVCFGSALKGVEQYLLKNNKN